MLLLVLPMPLYAYYQARSGWLSFRSQLRGAWWLLAFLVAIIALSWAGSTEFNGHGLLHSGWDQLSVAVAALCFYFWGVRSGWRTPALEAEESAAVVLKAPALPQV